MDFPNIFSDFSDQFLAFFSYFLGYSGYFDRFHSIGNKILHFLDWSKPIFDPCEPKTWIKNLKIRQKKIKIWKIFIFHIYIYIYLYVWLFLVISVLKYINISIILPLGPIFDVPKHFFDDQKIIEQIMSGKKCLGSPPSYVLWFVDDVGWLLNDC